MLLQEKKKNELEILFEYVVNRHFPKIKKNQNKPIELLKIFLEKQIDLVINWMRVGFIHGVMNTDNMCISGETIDYGPCAFMDVYDPKTVFSSIDQMGRYAYCNQPVITKWNLSRFAECLLPLINKNENEAVKQATEVIDTFEKIYEEKWLVMMRNKLGLSGKDVKDKMLILDLLTWMHQNKVDYTNTFLHLMNIVEDKKYNNKDFQNWKKRWKERLSINHSSQDKYKEKMKNTNPVFIPRNHKVEEALKSANNGSIKELNILLDILKNPYNSKNIDFDYLLPQAISKEKYQTFCGT